MNDFSHNVRAFLWPIELVFWRSIAKPVVDFFSIKDWWTLEEFMWDLLSLILMLFCACVSHPLYVQPEHVKLIVSGILLLTGLVFGMQSVRISLDGVVGKWQYHIIHQVLFGIFLGMVL